MPSLSVTAVVTSLLFAVSVDATFQRGNEKMSWMEANKWCDAQGWELASIHSVADISGAKQVAGGQHVWIGGVRSYADNTQWVWSDGSAWSIANWHSGEPNNSGGNENCAVVYGGWGTWNDAACSNQFYPLCRTTPATSHDMSYVGMEPERVLGICMGDCDGDNWCIGDLICVHDRQPNGCSGSVPYWWQDTCAERSVNAAATGGADVDPEFQDAVVSNDSMKPEAERKWNPTMIGAAVGVGAVAILLSVAVVVAMRKKTTAKEVGCKQVDAVHVPDESVVANTVKEQETEMEVVNGPEPDVGAVAAE